MYTSTEPPICADATWQTILTEAEAQVKTFDSEAHNQNFGMRAFLALEVLDHTSLAGGLAYEIGGKLNANSTSGSVNYSAVLMAAFDEDPQICTSIAADIERFKVVDPACDGLLGVYLFYKGVHALACARVAHHFWNHRGHSGRLIARLLQSEMADVRPA